MSATSTVPPPEGRESITLGWIRGISIFSKFLIAGGLFLTLAGLYGTTLESATSLRVGTNLWIGYQSLRIAQAAKRLDSRIAVLEGRSTSSIMEALKIGTIDAATLTLDEAVRVASDGTPISVVLVLDVSDGADVIVARTEAAASAGPRGRRVGVETGAVGALVLFRWLTLIGLQVSDVTIVDIPPPDHPRAFADLDVDFLVTYEPIASKSLPSTAVLVFDSSNIPGEIVDVLVVRRDRLRAQLANLRDLKRAWFYGTAEINGRTLPAISHLSSHQDLEPDDITTILEKLRFPSEAENAEILRHGRLKSATDRIEVWLDSAGFQNGKARNLTFSDALLRNQLE